MDPIQQFLNLEIATRSAPPPLSSLKKSLLSRGKPLSGQSQTIIQNVLNYFQHEKELGDFAFSVDRAIRRTAEATGVGKRTVHKIRKKSAYGIELITPGQKRPNSKPAFSKIDEQMRWAIKYRVRNMLQTYPAPSLTQLFEIVRNDLHFEQSKTTFWRILKELGFKYSLERNSFNTIQEMADVKPDTSTANNTEQPKKTRSRRKLKEETTDLPVVVKRPKLEKKISTKEKIPDVSKFDFACQRTSSLGGVCNLKIASWNVNGLRAWIEKDGLSYIQHEDPDVMCIQETKCSEKKLPEGCKIEGYHAYWSGAEKEGYAGTGMYTKKIPLGVTFGIGNASHDTEGRVITTEFDKFYLVTTYVPNSGRRLVNLTYRTEKWDRDFREYLKNLDTVKPVILCGDLNVSHNEIDLKNPKANRKNAGFTQQERDGFTELLDAGFTDTFRHLYPEVEGAYTFWTYVGAVRTRNIGWRLDYFVVSERLVPNVCDSVMRSDVMGSDHCPVALMLSL